MNEEVMVTLSYEKYQELLKIKNADSNQDIKILVRLLKASIIYLRNNFPKAETDLIEAAKLNGYYLKMQRDTENKKLDDIELILSRL